MCDTVALWQDDRVWFAKNSDREPDEIQRMEWQLPETNLQQRKATYITVDAPATALACWLSRPDWMWGAEIGINEKGVAIGNEAVFTRLIDRRGKALLGMDLLRLALEQSLDSDQALNVITGYLQQYGQGGPAGFRDKRFRYDNSFLIVDAKGGWQLETAGRHWVAKRLSRENPRIAISNSLSIECEFERHSEGLHDFARDGGYWSGQGELNFCQAFSTRFMPWAGRADKRRSTNYGQLCHLTGPMDSPAPLAAILRQHVKGDTDSSNADVCMHARHILRPSHTTQSLIACIQADRYQAWATGSPTPCMSLFKPLYTDGRSWLVDRQDFWQEARAVSEKCYANPRLRERLRALNLQTEQNLWRADPQHSENILDNWWQDCLAISGN